MFGYKWTRWVSFILSALVVLTLGNSVAPSLHEDSFTIALLLPWHGPREFGYLILNGGIVAFLAGIGAVLYSDARHQEKSSVPSRFLWTALCSAIVYLCFIAPSELLFIDGRSKDLFGAFVSHIENQMTDKFAVMAVVVFGVSAALLGLLVEYLFYILPKLDEGERLAVSGEFSSEKADKSDGRMPEKESKKIIFDSRERLLRKKLLC